MLFTSEDIAGQQGPAWVHQAHQRFREVLLEQDYPCYFGGQAERHGELRYSFVVGDELGHLPTTLTDFVRLSRNTERNRHILVVFFDEHGDLRSDGRRFWELLQWLHDHDPEPWPAAIPADPADPGWEFCFSGDPMFVFPSIPGYRDRRSRRIGDYFTLCFQPRRIFAGVERQDPGGEAIRASIYQRVRKWDALPPHPDLEFLAYGDPEMREWKQYILPDDNEPLPSACPLHISPAQ